ncbi:MAG: GntR family transcriptional regulator [Gemmatimonadota bacterium]
MRRNLPGELAECVGDRLADGLLAPGSRIDIATLVRELEVSVTPLRETLAYLAGQGLVVQRARFGFFVPPLDERTVRAAYDLRMVHLTAALRLSPAPSRARCRALRSHRPTLFPRSADPQTALDMMDEWFLDLVGGCDNPALQVMVRASLVRVRPFERGRLATGETEIGPWSFRSTVESRLAEGCAGAAAEALWGHLSADATRAADWFRRTRPAAEVVRRAAPPGRRPRGGARPEK